MNTNLRRKSMYGTCFLHTPFMAFGLPAGHLDSFKAIHTENFGLFIDAKRRKQAKYDSADIYTSQGYNKDLLT